ncbi:MAG: c-type cytochrome biogenesis protein CcsB [Jatrophihabitans endophyticus]|nr:c-type cytochrome biogenesis protein CcsB [Jatrophihabitans endophyticus]
MVGYTAEFAFGRVARKTVAAPVEAAQPAKVLVGAGGPSVADTSVPPVETPPVSTKRSAADRIGRLSVLVTLVGVLVHAASITVRAVAVDAVPWSNMYEFASVAGLIGVAAFLIVMIKAPSLRFLGGFILLPVILMMFLAGTVLYSKASPLVPALQSYWLAIHVTLVSFAEGALMTSAVLTALFLVRSHYDKRSAKPGFTPSANVTWAERLPSAATLDKAAYRIVAFAFPLYTVAIICGAIWAEAAWGRYWGWDPKETWAFIVWVVYACYLHARATAGWKGRAAAWVNLLGFACITVNFLVVNLVVSGLHSYAGLS